MRLIIVLDPDDRLDGLSPDMVRSLKLRQAMLAVPDGLDDKDIYAIARRLAELLLETAEI